MELRDLEYFSVVARHAHVGRAAVELGLSQPALSKSLRRLEQSLGVRLVKRIPKGVELTAVGAALVSRVRGLQLSLADVAREAADLGGGRAGLLRIGTGPALAETFLPDVCAELLSDAPRVTVNVELAAGTADILLPALRRGELDLIVNHARTSPSIYQGLRHEPLWDDEFVVHASVRHRLARRKALTLADLASERWVVSRSGAASSAGSLRQTFDDHGLPAPQIVLVSDSTLLRQRLIAASNLLGFGSKRAIASGAWRARLTVLRVQDARWIRPVAIVYRADAYLSPAATRFIEILKTAARREEAAVNG